MIKAIALILFNLLILKVSISMDGSVAEAIPIITELHPYHASKEEVAVQDTIIIEMENNHKIKKNRVCTIDDLPDEILKKILVEAGDLWLKRKLHVNTLTQTMNYQEIVPVTCLISKKLNKAVMELREARAIEAKIFLRPYDPTEFEIPYDKRKIQKIKSVVATGMYFTVVGLMIAAEAISVVTLGNGNEKIALLAVDAFLFAASISAFILGSCWGDRCTNNTEVMAIPAIGIISSFVSIICTASEFEFLGKLISVVALPILVGGEICCCCAKIRSY